MGRWGDQAAATSLYTRLVELHPARQAALLGAALAGGLMLARRPGR